MLCLLRRATCCAAGRVREALCLEEGSLLLGKREVALTVTAADMPLGLGGALLLVGLLDGLCYWHRQHELSLTRQEPLGSHSVRALGENLLERSDLLGQSERHSCFDCFGGGNKKRGCVFVQFFFAYLPRTPDVLYMTTLMG